MRQCFNYWWTCRLLPSPCRPVAGLRRKQWPAWPEFAKGPGATLCWPNPAQIVSPALLSDCVSRHRGISLFSVPGSLHHFDR
jgi:hypothetical protein